MTRRDLLTLLATTPLAGRVSAPAVSLGFSLYGMKNLSVAQAIRACAAIGYDGVELCLTPGWSSPSSLSPADRREIGHALQSSQLCVLGLMEQLSFLERDMPEQSGVARIQQAAELGHELGLRRPLLETVIGGKLTDWDVEKNRMAERLGRWARVAESAGITLCVKAHAGAAVNTPDKLLWLFRQAKNPALRLTYDFSHFQMAGLPLAGTLQAIIPYCSFIHVKDVTGDADHPHFLLAGDGTIDYATYFRLLSRSGYSGPIVAEVSAQLQTVKGYDATAAAKHSYLALARGLKEAGLARTWKPS